MKLELLAGAFALSLVACVPAYKPPTADQPHAIVKLRRSYEVTPGTYLREVVDIDDHRALAEDEAVTLVTGPRIDSVLVHPVPSNFVVTSGFFHQERQFVRESYQESHTEYRMESYDCSSGFGSNKSYRTCTRSVPHTRYETKYRDVWKTVEVSDGMCEASLRIAPQDRHVYLFQFTYYDHSGCNLSCYEQVGAPDGTFKNLTCPVAPAP